MFADLAANCRCALDAMLLRRAGPDDWRVNPDQLVALVFVVILVRLLTAVAVNGLDGSFSFQALAADITLIGALLFAAFVTAKLTGAPRLLLAYPVAVLSMGSFFLLLHGVLRWASAGEAPVFPHEAARYTDVLLIAWFFLAAFVLLLRFAPRRPVRASAGFGLYCALLVGTLWWLPPQDLWLARPADAAAARQPSVADEAIFHAQPVLLERALAALAPERPGVPDIYFVGFGAYSHEDVFMKEIRVIEELFRERFDAEGRTLALINNAQTAAEVPLASATNLARVLKHIGRLMNPAEDVLVLYLTSHGSEDHRLAVVNAPLRLNEIDPPALKGMLDESGIRWRVLAISACYAGGFIEPLKNEATIIMTAAEATRQSFGCGTESEFTFFGRAVFDEELRRTHSFVEAFERARVTIAERERAGKFEPSNPQIHVGAAIAQKLREVEAHQRQRSIAAGDRDG